MDARRQHYRKLDSAYLKWRAAFDDFRAEYGYLTPEEIAQRRRWEWLQRMKAQERKR